MALRPHGRARFRALADAVGVLGACELRVRVRVRVRARARVGVRVGVRVRVRVWVRVWVRVRCGSRYRIRPGERRARCPPPG